MFPLQGGMPTTTYVDDVFSTYLYTANNSTQTINNGIDLAGKGGMVWIKGRSNTESHAIFDTVRGATKNLSSNSTGVQSTYADTLTSFNSTGFTLGADALTVGLVNNGTQIGFTSWTFRKAPKFFDVVTYTGTGTSNLDVPHSLEITPGMIIIKRVDQTGSWYVYHKDTTNANWYLLLNSTAAQAGDASVFPTTPTSVNFRVGGGTTTNVTGATYIAYLFAHNTDTDGLIQCGSFIPDAGGGNATINLGWEPQFMVIKKINTTSDWWAFDSLRNWTNVASGSSLLRPNANSAEITWGSVNTPTATGFNINSTAGDTFVYMAIRRPNKPPTSGTQVFQPIIYTANNANNRLITTGIVTDAVMVRARTQNRSGFTVGDRLRGQPYFLTGLNDAEATSATGFDQQLIGAVEYGNAFSSMTGFYAGNASTPRLNVSSDTMVAYAFKRAPKFFEQVCYTGAGSMTVPHNLGVLPGFVLTKRRNVAGTWRAAFRFGVGNQLVLSSNAALASAGTSAIGFTEAYLEFYGGADTSLAGATYISLLFASFPGISSIGTYTGNGGTANVAGTDQIINCGFSAGARFVLIKRTDSTGDWYTFDTARGIIAATDPYLTLNASAAEVTTVDILDPDTGGFIVNQTATENLNVTGASYAYFAIA